MNLHVGQKYTVTDSDTFTEYCSVEEPLMVSIHSIAGLDVVVDIEGESTTEREKINKNTFKMCCDNRILI